MTKQSVTLESLSDTVESLASSVREIGHKIDDLTTTVNDHTESIQYLVEKAVTREDVRQIVHDELRPIESRLNATMDVLVGNYQKHDGEILAMRYEQDQLNHRVDVVEQTIGLPKVM